MEVSIYQTCYDLINNYVFGGTAIPESYEALVCIAVSTCACLFLFALPFIITWRIIRTFL